MAAGEGDDQVARAGALRRGEIRAALEEHRAAALSPVHLGKDQLPALPGRAEDPPLGGQAPLGRGAAGGVEPVPLRVIEVEPGAAAAAFGGAV